jgi:hypothetical protein
MTQPAAFALQAEDQAAKPSSLSTDHRRGLVFFLPAKQRD